jgi:hypothetical protein
MSKHDESGYTLFENSDEMKMLTESNHIRIEEELVRPRVECWPEDFDWQQWTASHRKGSSDFICGLQSMRASPYCALGYH